MISVRVSRRSFRLSLAATLAALLALPGCVAEIAEVEGAPPDEPIAEATAAFTSSSWSLDNPIPNSHSQMAPAIAGTQCMVHPGVNNTSLYGWVPGAGSDWSISGESSGKTPALTGVGNSSATGATYMIHQGGSYTSTDLWMSVSHDCKTWTRPWSSDQGDVQIPFSSNNTPGVAIFNGKLFMVHTGSSDNALRFASYDPLVNAWSADAYVPSAKQVGTAPALSHYNGKLYLAYQEAYSQNTWWQSYDGSIWTAPQLIPNVHGVPSIAAYGGYLHLVHLNGTSQINYTNYNGSTWSTDAPIPGHMAVYPPSIAPINDDGASFATGLIMAHNSDDGSQRLWYATLY